MELCVSAQEHAYNNGFDTLIIDTAGRLQIDSDMISELKSIKEKIKVHETMLVIDSMIGQEAINVAKDFDQEVNIESILFITTCTA